MCPMHLEKQQISKIVCESSDFAGAPKGSAEALLVALQELQAEAEALARDAEQLARDAVAFEQPEPQFAQLPPLQVRFYLIEIFPL